MWCHGAQNTRYESQLVKHDGSHIIIISHRPHEINYFSGTLHWYQGATLPKWEEGLTPAEENLTPTKSILYLYTESVYNMSCGEIQ